MIVKYLFLPSTIFLCVGCSTLTQEEAFEDVNRLTRHSGADTLLWVRTPDESLQVRQRVERLLSLPLSLDNAVRIALINSRHLQAVYSEVGIAQSELVQAGLFTNPILGYSLAQGNGMTQSTLSVEWGFLDILWIPMRQHLSALALQETQYRIGNEVLQYVRDTKLAYLDLQVAFARLKAYEPVLNSSEVSARLAARQYAAGNLPKRNYLAIYEEYLQNHTESIRLNREVASARETLNRILGLYGTQTRYALAEYDGEFALDAMDTETIERSAVECRLDVKAARKRLEHDAVQAGYAVDTRLLSEGSLEFDREKNSGEADALKTFGAKVALPIFDIGQGRVARTKSLYLQSLHGLYETTVNARSEVRQAYAEVRYAYDIAAEYRDRIVPVRRQILEETQKHYNGMLEGIEEVLKDQRILAERELELIERVGEFKKATARFDYVSGGKTDGTR